MNRFLVFAVILCLSCAGAMAQTERLQYWRDVPAFLEAQTAALIKELQAVLEKYPPQLNVSAERKLALFSIDGLLHDTRLDTTQALKSFIRERNELVINDLVKSVPGKGIQIYKLYNQGFLVRTGSVTIGFDLVLANTKNGPLIDSAQMEQIATLCDVLFVSHVHGDHADLKVARMFAAKQKPVFTPPGMWEKESPYISVLRDEKILKRKIPLRSGKIIEVVVFPGHQDETVLNNVYAVTSPEGYTVMHTGDQYNKSDLLWMDKVSEVVRVDALLLHCWIHDVERTVKGVQPMIVVSGHENEMAHSIDHREPYWLTFRRMKNISAPFLVMAWGESYFYQR